MAFRIGKRYTGRVVEGRLYESSVNKTPGFQIILDTEDGTIDYTIWLTQKNREKALRDFDTLGVAAGALTDRNFLTFQLPQVVVGREVAFEPKDEEYPKGSGKFSTKVPWIGKPGSATEEELAQSVAALFAAGSRTTAGEAPSTADLNAMESDDAASF